MAESSYGFSHLPQPDTQFIDSYFVTLAALNTPVTVPVSATTRYSNVSIVNLTDHLVRTQINGLTSFNGGTVHALIPPNGGVFNLKIDLDHMANLNLVAVNHNYTPGSVLAVTALTAPASTYPRGYLLVTFSS